MLTACSAVPSDGPSAGAIRNATAPGTDNDIPVIDIAEAPVSAYAPVSAMVAGTVSGEGLARLQSSGFSGQRLRRGDVITITVFDTGEDGLFSSTSSSRLDLGQFTIDDSGFVTLPFVGRQRAVESTPEALQTQIVNGLRGSAVSPQAVVTVVDRPSSTITVNGAVRAAGQFPLTAKRERVLDAIALAGGAEGEPGATTVTLARGSQRASAPLSRVLAEDRQNVYLQPDDQVFVEGDAPSFTAFGAFGSNGEFAFETDQLTLAQAIARAGGPQQDRADARNIYLFRAQSIEAATYFPTAGKDGLTAASVPASGPVIYRINLRDPANFLIAQRILMRDGDILYATNAPLANVAKLFTTFQKAAPAQIAPQPGSL